MTKDQQHPFIQERLDALHEVDNKLVSVLAHTSSALNTLIQLKKNSTDQIQTEQLREDFSKDVSNFKEDLRYAAENLKREIATLDSRIGKTGDGGITIIPVNISKKATFAGEEKFKSQVEHLEKLVNDIKQEDVKMKTEE